MPLEGTWSQIPAGNFSGILNLVTAKIIFQLEKIIIVQPIAKLQSNIETYQQIFFDKLTEWAIQNLILAHC